METIAHSPQFAREAGVSQKVGKDFARADDRAGITKTHNGKPTTPRDAHMADRKRQGLSHREVAAEFGTSKSTAHRRVVKALRQGFTREGSAK